MRYKIRITSIVLFLLIISPASAGITDSCQAPERIILNPAAEPAHEQAVTWRTRKRTAKPMIQLAPPRAESDLEDFAESFPAVAEMVATTDTEYAWHYSALLEGLEAGTRYYYRVGSDENWSEWISFTTAEDSFAPFSFVFLGDPQVGLRSYCPRLFRKALRTAPDARFWLFAGDQVNVGDSDQEWGDFFSAGSWIFRETNIIPVAGNHEYPRSADLLGRELTPLWKPHYTLPLNGPEGLDETAYWVDYQGLKLIVLNNTVVTNPHVNEKAEEQRDWLAGVLEENEARWTIVSMHQPIYSTGSERDNPELQKLLLPLFDEYGVDLVLQGHDHTYGRTYPLKAGQIASGGEKGTIYVVSSSGSKFYDQNPLYLHLMAETALDTQLFQVIDLEEDALHYRAVTATGEVIDQFTVRKK